MDPWLDKYQVRRRIPRSEDLDIDAMAGPVPIESTVQLSSAPSLRLVVISMLAILLGLGFRAIQIQLVRGQDYRDRSEYNRIQRRIVPAPRGSITDRFGVSLAENVPNMILAIIPADLPKQTSERESVLIAIAERTNLPISTIHKLLQENRQRPTEPLTLRDQVPYAEAMQYVVDTADLSAVTVVSVPRRTYPLGSTAAAILGYTGLISPTELAVRPTASQNDIIGKTGIEQMYNDALTGRDGERQIERDVGNREQRVLAYREPRPGQTLETTLDAGLQQKLMTQLQSMVSTKQAPGAAAVAMDPRNGEILAMVSLPTFDNNWFTGANYQPEVQASLTDPRKILLNRAISGQYPSGSIVKPIIAAAALSENLVTASTAILSNGGFTIGHDVFPDWKAGGHGSTTITKAIAESVNTFFYAIGGGYESITGLGVDRMVSYLQRFGWGRLLGIDLPTEASGFLPTKEWRTAKRPSPWKLGDTYHLAIGQGDLDVTPLQVTSAISAIANGGTLYRPRIVRSLSAPETQQLKLREPEVIAAPVVDDQALAIVRAGMRQGVESGSSRSLLTLPVSSAAKTGTAQFGNEGKTHSWFTAFAPYENPQIVITVLVEAGGEGNAAALPVAKEVLNWYFSSGAGNNSAD